MNLVSVFLLSLNCLPLKVKEPRFSAENNSYIYNQLSLLRNSVPFIVATVLTLLRFSKSVCSSRAFCVHEVVIRRCCYCYGCAFDVEK